MIDNIANFFLSEDAKALLKRWEEFKRPVERPSWDEFFIEEAFRAAQRSLDSQTKCGSVIVTYDNVPLSTGYNSFIRKVDDSVLPNVRPDKYDWMVHGEHNAILNCARLGKSTLGTKIYVTGEPCLNCFQYMYQAGITEIIHTTINKANMTVTDKEYAAKVEVFKWLTKDKLKVRTIDIDTRWLDSLSVKIKAMKNNG